MNKKAIIIGLIFAFVSAIVLIFGNDMRNYTKEKLNITQDDREYLYSSRESSIGKLTLKIRLDDSGAIREVAVIEYPNIDGAEVALQKLVRGTIDKESANEIEPVDEAMELSSLYKEVVASILTNPDLLNYEAKNEKISLKEPDVISNIERQPVNESGYKSGLGGYVINQFQDADYNKNGNLVTNEYICAVLLNTNNKIEAVKFDHISSNLSFDKKGTIPTGTAKAYAFTSDKSKPGFNGLVNGGDFVNIFEFENQVKELKFFEAVKNKYAGKKGYLPFVNALENAVDNARFIGASSVDTMGLSCYKVLRKKDIIDATENNNGKVKFKSDYCLITMDKNNNISSCMFDNVDNVATITNSGKIFGGKEKEIYTLNELANTNKYSKIDVQKFELKVQYNGLCDMIRGYTVDNILGLVSKLTDDRGIPKEDGALASFKNIDFIEFIDLISRAYLEAMKIGN